MIGVPFEIAGGTGGHKSIQFSSEVSRNVYIDFSDTAGRKGQHDFPGLKPWHASAGVDRGSHVMSGTLYKISGTTLYSVSAVGVQTALGTVAGTERAVFANDGVNLMFCVEGLLYRWNSPTLSNVSVGPVPNPRAIAYINSQFVVSGDNGIFAVSDPGSATSWNALNYAEEETLPDSLLRPYTYSQMVYMLGSQSVVPWVNVGTGNPPFSRQETALVNIGLANKHAVINTDNFLYWLSDDKKLYQCVGASARNVTTPGASYLLDDLDASTCILSEFTIQGQQFVLLAFSGRTLFFSESNNYWGELSGGTDIIPAQWYGNYIFACYGKTLVTDYRNGNVYELDRDAYTDNGDARLRVRELPVFTSALVGKPGRRITVSGVKLDMQVGVGLASGQGSQPVLVCQFSNDGGHTWGEEINVDMGIMGDYTAPAYAYGFANGYNIKVRLKCSDPVFLSLFGGIIYLREAGY